MQLCTCADWDLAAATESFQQRSLAISFRTRAGIVEERQRVTNQRVPSPAFDCQRSLPGCGTHLFNRKNLSDEFRSSQAIESGNCENNGIVLTRFQFPQPGVNVSAQWMNYQVWTQRFQLCFPS